MPSSVSSPLRRYATYWLAWTAAGLFYFTQDFVPRLYRHETVPWQNVFVGWMTAMYISAACTPAILWLGNRWPVEQAHRWRRAAIHFGWAAVFAIVETAVEAPALIYLRVFPVPAAAAGVRVMFWTLLVYGFHGNVIRYWAVVAVQMVWRARRNAEQREQEALRLQLKSSELAAQLSGAHLRALKMQLQPHFLFNTLGAIMVLVRQRKPEQADQMLARLSELLRLALEDVEAQEVPLWRELEFLRLYLSIEQVRFEDRLDVRIQADPELSEALVPHMALQPLVENAVRHGLGQSEQPVRIEIAARRHASTLELTVTDDGPGCPVSGFEGKGIGLANTRDRLHRLYGDASALHAENLTPRGVRVRMTLPFHAGCLEDECA